MRSLLSQFCPCQAFCPGDRLHLAAHCLAIAFGFLSQVPYSTCQAVCLASYCPVSVLFAGTPRLPAVASAAPRRHQAGCISTAPPPSVLARLRPLPANASREERRAVPSAPGMLTAHRQWLKTEKMLSPSQSGTRGDSSCRALLAYRVTALKSCSGDTSGHPQKTRWGARRGHGVTVPGANSSCGG